MNRTPILHDRGSVLAASLHLQRDVRNRLLAVAVIKVVILYRQSVPVAASVAKHSAGDLH